MDRDSHGIASFVEAQRRLGQRWRLELELRAFRDVEDPSLTGIAQDGFLTLRLERFFQGL